MKFLFNILISCAFILGSFAAPIASYADDLTNLIKPADSYNSDIPDPSFLKLNWADYFEVSDMQELATRITGLSQNLNTLISNLEGSEKENAASYLNNILLNLNTLLAEKKQAPLELPILKPFKNTYSIEDRLDLHNKIRLLSIEKKSEEEDLSSIKNSIAKKQKQLDAMTITYLSLPSFTQEKMLLGLEIMSSKTSVLAAQVHLKKALKRLEIEKIKLSFLQKELDAAIDLFDPTAFNAEELENNIKKAEAELERKQTDLSRIENSLPLSVSQNVQDKSNRHLLSQKLIHAAALRSLAWTNLSFHNLKYNFYMHINAHFQETHKEMLDKLEEWNQNLDKTNVQIDEWKKAVLREQERVHQDRKLLVVQHEPADSKSMRLNQARRQESLDAFAALQLLKTEVYNARWLIEEMQTHIRRNSSFLELSWMNISQFFGNTSDFVEDCLNYTLFKLGELPITAISLLRIAIILTLSFFASKLIGKALISFGNRGASVTASTLYTLGRLAHYFTLIIGCLIALASIGFDFSNLVLVASALTLGIGFGLQSFANNFICGLRILFERNLKVGDFIELQTGTSGRVVEIHVQNTIILTSDGIEIVIPNSELTNQTLINYTMNNDYRRITVPFSVSSDADKNLVKKVVTEAALKVAIAAPIQYGTPQIWLQKFDKYSMDFALAVWVNYKKKSQTGSKEADFLWEIETALRENKIPLTTASPTIFLSKDQTLSELTTEYN